LNRIAKESGKALDEEDEIEEEDTEYSEDEQRHYELASRLLRFFTHHDNDYFFVFVECGVTREITVVPVFDQTQLELAVSIPKPENELFHFVGIKKASDVHIEDTEELIYIEPPRKLSSKKEEKFYYPSEELPLFVVFKY
jgi:hypothetical protein